MEGDNVKGQGVRCEMQQWQNPWKQVVSLEIILCFFLCAMTTRMKKGHVASDNGRIRPLTFHYRYSVFFFGLCETPVCCLCPSSFLFSPKPPCGHTWVTLSSLIRHSTTLQLHNHWPQWESFTTIVWLYTKWKVGHNVGVSSNKTANPKPLQQRNDQIYIQYVCCFVFDFILLVQNNKSCLHLHLWNLCRSTERLQMKKIGLS